MYIGSISGNYTMPINYLNRMNSVDADSTLDGSAKIKGASKCETCENRMYVDGSNESDVSFKTPGHISPEQSYGKVLSHEKEHVSNAIAEGNKPNAKLISASVSLKMATCPECGKRYVSGGLTKTAIQYTESVPYDKGRKLIEGSLLKGMNFDEAI